MNAHAYTEDQPAEQPSVGLFGELGWQVIGPQPNAGAAGAPADARLLGRRTKGKVVLVGRLRAALETLNANCMDNDAFPHEAIHMAIHELIRDRSVLSPYLNRTRPA